MADKTKPVFWIGSSRRDLQAMPRQVRSDIGQALYTAQQGMTDPAAKPLKGFGGTRVMDNSPGWQAWEDIFSIKAAVETSGYKTRKDIEGAIRALEGMQMKSSLAHPQGDKLIRKEDHAGIIDCYISRVEGGKLEVKKRIPKEELAKNMPLRHDLSKMRA